MEGTRHERAALVGVAYFLGFLTTFIWLGYSSSTAPVAPVIPAVAQPASVVTAVKAEPAPVEEITEPGVVTYTDGALEVSALGGSRTLSFNVEQADIEVGEEFARQGTHVGEIAYAASPTGEFVFFCEQKTLEADTCSPFVYDVLTDKIYPVTKGGELVDLLTSAAKDVSWTQNELMVGTVRSVEAGKPWALSN